MEIQIFSDIHLEFYKQYPKIDKKAELLFLAGDIGKINHKNFDEFISYVNDTWERTYYVLGNHEFYHNKKTHIKLLQEYQDFFDNYSNIILVQPGKEYYYKGFRIIGSTLWSHAYCKYTNCFNNIKMFDESKYRKCPISLNYYNSLYEDHLNLLKQNIKDKTIILTHYPVTQFNTSHPKFNNQSQEVKDIFANNLLDELNVKDCIFISGHTHYSFDFEYKSNRFISNQFGYPDEINETGINENGLYIIDKASCFINTS